MVLLIVNQKAEYQGYWAWYHGLLSQAERYTSPETQKAYAEAYSLGQTAKTVKTETYLGAGTILVPAPKFF